MNGWIDGWIFEAEYPGLGFVGRESGGLLYCLEVRFVLILLQVGCLI